jgi:hypothetical protein
MTFRVKLRIKSVKPLKPDEARKGLAKYRDALRAPLPREWIPHPWPLFPQTPPQNLQPNRCARCGRSFTDSMGRLVPMGVVCGVTGCPTGFGGWQALNMAAAA